MKRNLLLASMTLLIAVGAQAQFSFNVGYIHETMRLSEPIWPYGQKNVGMWGLFAEIDYNIQLPHQLGVTIGASIYQPTTASLSDMTKDGYADYYEKNLSFPVRAIYTFPEVLWGWSLSPFIGVQLQYTYGDASFSEDATPMTIHYLDEDNVYAIKPLTLMPLVGVRAHKGHWQFHVQYMPISTNRSLHGNYTNCQSGLTVEAGYIF